MADFQANPEIQALNIRVLAASVDTAAQAAGVVSEVGLSTVEVASDLDGLAVAETVGAYIDTSNAPYLQPAAFILNPDGNVIQGLFSSNVLGRLTSADVVQIVKFFGG